LRAWIRREPERREAALQFARDHATFGDPASVLATLDRYAREERFLMNVGPEKGPLLEGCVLDAGPDARILELGSFVGYSAILMARHLSDHGRLVSVDISPTSTRIAREMATLAGVVQRIDFITGRSTDQIEHLDGPFDLVFLDHWKALYKPDVERLLARRLLRSGATLIADNVGPMFGENPYLAWMQAHPEFESHYVRGHVEYKTIEDAALISRWRGSGH
jgi:catechol O-methyltransferase